MINFQPEIICISEYGSHARGDQDIHSDRDFVAIIVDSAWVMRHQLRKSICRKLKISEEGLSIYTISEIDYMVSRRSLFLWHLKLESKSIFDSRDFFKLCLNKLRPFNGYRRDISKYTLMLKSIERSFLKFGLVNQFDLALIFTIWRNVCILYCFQKGRPNFGRKSAFVVAKKFLKNKINISSKVYSELMRWKMAYNRGVKCNMPLPSRKKFESILAKSNKIVNYSKRNLV